MSDNATLVLILLVVGATIAAVWWAEAFVQYSRLRYGQKQKVVEVVELGRRAQDEPTQPVGGTDA